MKTNANKNMISSRLQLMREEVLNAPQEISIIRAKAFTDAVRNYPDEPRSIQFAYGLRETLGKLPIKISGDDQIVGELTEKFKGAVLNPEIKSDFLINELNKFSTRKFEKFLLTDKEKNELQENILPFWKENSAFDDMRLNQNDDMLFLMNNLVTIPNNDFAGANHLAHINYSKVLDYGVNTILEQAANALENLSKSDRDIQKKQNFYNSVILSLNAVKNFARRYSALANELADKAHSSKLKTDFKKIAYITARVPALTANSFREAVQSFWFIFLALLNLDIPQEIPLGRLDQILYPYYKRDLDKNLINKNEALELISELFIKLNRLPHLKEIYATMTHSGGFPRTITLGGIDKEGHDAVNDLSFLMLDAVDNLRLIHPDIAIRLHPESSELFKKQVFQIIAKGANIFHLFNDEVMINGFIRMGFSIEEARNYIITGCVQPMPDSTYGPSCSNYINGPKILEFFLNNGKPITSITEEDGNLPDIHFDSYDEFWNAFKDQTKSILETVTDGMKVVHEVQDRLLPNPILSAMIDGTIENAKDVKSGGARHNITGIGIIGIGTLVDSLAAIRELVYVKKSHSLSEIITWLKANFKDYEIQRQILINRTPKYGNDIKETDQIASDIVDWIEEIFSKEITYRGGSYTLGLHSETLHVFFGKFTAATPDGRLQGDVFSPGCGPTSGMDQNGPTASLQSMAAIDYARVMGGGSANMRFNPALLQTDMQVEKFKAMVLTFFKLGGPHLAANVVDMETLRDAQKNPEKYQDLIVRVTGYSARFVDLNPDTQEEIIKRTEMNV